VLGRFLELSVAAPQILDSWQFYQRLGFSAATVGETWAHRYAVATDGRVALGLHETAFDGPLLCYVLPDLARRLPGLEAAGAHFESRVLGEHAFNEARFADPAGQRVRLLEARTFSPPPAATACVLGWFEEYALPVADLAQAQVFWERLGFVAAAGGDVPWPHLALTSDTLDLGLHLTKELVVPTLVFSHEDLAGLRAALAAAGIEPEPRLPRTLDPATHLLVVAPEGTRLLVGPPPA
jgi:catechol 2,3-dioxygenase-like lactoylglutathione lyase family enzyme